MSLSTRLTFDPSVRSRANGRILIGGSPTRIMRLSEQGAAVVRSWLRDEQATVAEGPQRTLAGRLIAAGIAHPVATPPASLTDQTGSASRPRHHLRVVIPCRDDHEHLHMTLAGLGHAPVTVVDDGSQEAVAVAGEIEVIRSPENRGPSAARNTGWTAVSATLDQVTSDNTIIGFIDAGVSIDEADMRDLVQHFDDPHIVAVAPRVQSRPGDDRISTYDRERSPLDMGPNPAAVQPGQPVSYVPGACLLVRLSKLVELDGFDETLRYGEDVDLVWRLSRQGIVRYEPSVVATHTPRSTLKGFARQRFGYGSSAGPLSQRHGTALTPLVISRWSLPIVGLTLLGHPIMAAGIASAYVPSQASKLGELPDPMIEAMRIVVSGNLSALQSTADTAVRIWSPLTLLLSFTPFRRVSAISAALAWGRMAMTDGVDKLPLRIIDDLAYAAGVWRHSVRWRTAAPLRPRIL